MKRFTLDISTNGAGDIVGEAAGETTRLRSATMRAVLTVHTLIVGYGRFSSFLDTHQGGSRAYRRVMAHRCASRSAVRPMERYASG